MAIALRTSGANTYFGTNTTVTVGSLSVTAGDIFVVVIAAHSSSSTVSVSDDVGTSYTTKAESKMDSQHAAVRIAWGACTSSGTATVTGTFGADNVRKSVNVYVFNPNGATITEDFYQNGGSGFVSADTQVSLGTQDVESSDAVVLFGTTRAGMGSATWNSPLIAGVSPDGSQAPSSTGPWVQYKIFSATDTGISGAVTPDTGDRYEMVFLGLQGASSVTPTHYRRLVGFSYG